MTIYVNRIVRPPAPPIFTPKPIIAVRKKRDPRQPFKWSHPSPMKGKVRILTTTKPRTEVVSMRTGLTINESKVLKFIETYIAQHGHSPSYEDIGKHMRLKAFRAGVNRYVKSLVKRGHVTYIPGHGRSLMVVKTESDCCPTCGQKRAA